jgi:VIT1/CCC1 family predicted Fe2+/Mn2+ transporter
MPESTASAGVGQELLRAQRSEITEFHIYSKLAQALADQRNASLLRRVAEDELRHYQFLRELTGQEVLPERVKVLVYTLLARAFGLTFALRLMERGEGQAAAAYSALARTVPGVSALAQEEDAHEDELLGLIDEEVLHYMGSVVLGLNDAIVELTGTLAGLSLALQETRLIATAGLITGVAASLSMAASEYLSTKSEADGRAPLRASLYTGVAYVVAVSILIAPFLLLPQYQVALPVSLLGAISLIGGFTFYVSVARELSFAKHFREMVLISMGVAALTFVFGFLVRTLLGLEI